MTRKLALMLKSLILMTCALGQPANSQMTTGQQPQYEQQRNQHMGALIPSTQAEADAAWADYDQLESSAARANAAIREQRPEPAPSSPQAQQSPLHDSVYFGYAMLDEANSCKLTRAKILATTHRTLRSFECDCLASRTVNDNMLGRLRVVNECLGHFALDPAQEAHRLQTVYGADDWYLRFAQRPLLPLSEGK